MLLRYFDQKVQKSRFAECGNSMVPFGTTKPIDTCTSYPIDSFYINKENKAMFKIVPGKSFFKGQSSKTQTVVKKGCKCLN